MRSQRRCEVRGSAINGAMIGISTVVVYSIVEHWHPLTTIQGLLLGVATGLVPGVILLSVRLLTRQRAAQ